MKIEIGESLIYSFLRHEKNCLITQTNWKPSGNWIIADSAWDKVTQEHKKISEHSVFSKIFEDKKITLKQMIKQTEIDVVGVGQNNHIYAIEIAFHEGGLLYTNKTETANRIIRKLLRCYLALKCYFPTHNHFIAFCSPTTTPGYEEHIKELFEILIQDFQTKNVEFYYFSNQRFNSEITENTLNKTISESDGSELFARSIKLYNSTTKYKLLGSSYNGEVNRKTRNLKACASEIAFPESSEKKIEISGISIPLTVEHNEKLQDYIRKIMRLLLDNNLISSEEIKRLQNKEYCKTTFRLQFPLLRDVKGGYKDELGRSRYWSREIFGKNFYVCSQWWKDYHITHFKHLQQWLMSLENQKESS